MPFLYDVLRRRQAVPGAEQHTRTDPAFKLVNALAKTIVDVRADKQFEKAMRAGKGEREQVCKLTQKVMEAVWAVKAECEPDNIREGERAICDPDCSFAVIQCSGIYMRTMHSKVIALPR